MSTVKVAQPDAAAIKAAPREFALCAQLKGFSSGSVAAEDLKALAEKYGNPAKAATLATSGEVSFKQLAEALKKSAPSNGAASGATNGESYGPGDGTECLAYAARDDKGCMSPFHFKRRNVGENDIAFQVTNCGICHSDYHQIFDEWKNTQYPVVPGHEIVGIVTEVGSGVSNFKVGERIGVGCMVNSCRTCPCCKEGEEQYCQKTPIFTYNSKDVDGTLTFGGYSTWLVTNKDFALHIPENLPLAGVAPLLCAGITVYSPMRHFGLDKPGLRLGVLGLGGLGHMAVKIAKAFGMEVTVFSTSPQKEKEARAGLGADHFVVSKDPEQMKAMAGTLDGIIDTVSAKHPVMDYLATLRLNGRLIIVGVPPEPLSFTSSGLVFGRKTMSGSIIGGIRETQEMLDFCGEHGITSDIEEISIDYLNTALERLVKNDVHYRFVIDIQGSLTQ